MQLRSLDREIERNTGTVVSYMAKAAEHKADLLLLPMRAVWKVDRSLRSVILMESILVPNDCGAMRPRVQALSTRAYENMVGVAMANLNGENAGCSCAFSPICWDENGEYLS